MMLWHMVIVVNISVRVHMINEAESYCTGVPPGKLEGMQAIFGVC